ncbi:hypothetical protein [Jidongwangia harbinensis]|uniref:hypothetical protein n=1 Tax=Jidongwangia harbinensis TaxID=2878561 RepID=UPI001CDA298A|nr:hypothetical protein [Jidongwangia harbinensis]MCA2219439.1 hypothetical protein [Jidongwangia harbinensis]
MSIGSISAGLVASAYDMMRPAGEGRAAEASGAESAAAAERGGPADEEGPIRSASATLGTLVDTYL